MGEVAEGKDSAVAAAIAITPEMEAAGFAAFCRSGLVDDPMEADKLSLAEIYRPMAAIDPARASNKPDE